MDTKFEGNNRDYTYRNYENTVFINQSTIQSLFNGSQFHNCSIETCDFSQCDYEGMNIVKTTFYNSSYKNADIKTVIWESCIFKDCIFDDAYISSNIFTNCKFDNCSFVNSAFINNKLYNCNFCNCNLFQSIFSLCVFNECHFIKMCLGNSSFYKQILHKCKYDEVSLNIDSLGQVYGLKQADIKNISYVFLGKEYGSIHDFGSERLIDVFKHKGWLFEEIILKYNCGKISNYEMIIGITDYFIKQIETERIIRKDEFDFSILIVNFLKNKNKLPLFALIYSYQYLYDKLTSNVDINSLNAINLKAFMNQIIIVINEMLEEYYSYAILGDTEETTESTITLHYKNCTSINFHNIINKLNYTFNLGINSPAKLIEIRKGSFIEIILSGIIGIAALQFFLYGVNGVLLQLIDLKAKIKVLKAKNPPKQIMKLTYEGKPEAYNIILKNMQNEQAKELCLTYANILKDTDFDTDTKSTSNENL